MLIKRNDGSRANYYTKGTVSMSVLSPGLLPYLHKRSCPVISDVRAYVMLCLGACYLLVCACVFFIDERDISHCRKGFKTVNTQYNTNETN